jgi:hypothetical protein
MCKARLKMNRRQAESYIHEVDLGRRKWTQYLYGVDWENPALYDVILNLETMDIPEASSVVTAIAQQQKCFHYDERCRASMDNFALATRVKAAIAQHPETADLEVETTAEGSKVWVRGKLHHSEQFEHVRKTAADVPGVTEINLDALSERYLQT